MLTRVLRPNSSTLKACSVRAKSNGIKIQNPSADFLPYKGEATMTKPIKVQLDAGKTYAWCSCGLSTKQPFCDGTHSLNGVTDVRPVVFQVEKSGEYRMCGCKQTGSRPICDGTHKSVDKTPRDFNATRVAMFGDASPVYDGVAHKLGYKPKNGGFQ